MTEPIMYGVWIQGKGWVRGEDTRVFATTHRQIAVELSKRLGRNTQVFYVDEALKDLEEKLLEAEKNTTYSWLFGLIKR